MRKDQVLHVNLRKDEIIVFNRIEEICFKIFLNAREHETVKGLFGAQFPSNF